jgi:eukaryotic-like serine/threonine-protein kinase
VVSAAADLALRQRAETPVHKYGKFGHDQRTPTAHRSSGVTALDDMTDRILVVRSDLSALPALGSCLYSSSALHFRRTETPSMTILEAFNRRDATTDEGAADASSLDDPRLISALEEYLQIRRSGRRPDRIAFLARYADVAEALSEALDGLEWIHSVAGKMSSGRPTHAVSDLLSPATRLGEYQIIREIGRGGMGIVYEAEQLDLGRKVALKVLSAGMSLDPRRLRRFQVEAQAAALLYHENIVPVFGVGCDQGVHFYAMQFIEGRSLADLISELGARNSTEITKDLAASQDELECDSGLGESHARAFETDNESTSWSGFTGTTSSPCSLEYCRTVAGLGKQAADALDHAHMAGVIHRDIKPSNLLVDARGFLRVTDFGLARISQDGVALTQTGDLVGTLRYMSPEQIRGDPVEIGPSADLYSLGATLYELLTLRPPFDGQNRQDLLHRVLTDEPFAPRRINPSIPRDLETIVLKAMAKEPSMRYASAREMADDLRCFLDDRPIHARRPSIGDRFVRWSRRNRTIIVTAATVLVLALSVSTWLLWQAKRGTDRAMRLLLEEKIKVDRALGSSHRASLNQRIALEKSISMLDLISGRMRSDGGPAGLTRVPGPERDAIYRVVVDYYDYVADHCLADEQMTSEVVAKAQRRSGYFRNLLKDPRWRTDYHNAILTYDNLRSLYPDHLWQRTDQIGTIQEYSQMLLASGDVSEAARANRHALDIAEGLLAYNQIDQPCYYSAMIKPFHALAANLVARPVLENRDRELAVRLARKVVQWAPDQREYRRTLTAAESRVEPATPALLGRSRSDPPGAIRATPIPPNRAAAPARAPVAQPPHKPTRVIDHQSTR